MGKPFSLGHRPFFDVFGIFSQFMIAFAVFWEWGRKKNTETYEINNWPEGVFVGQAQLLLLGGRGKCFCQCHPPGKIPNYSYKIDSSSGVQLSTSVNDPTFLKRGGRAYGEPATRVDVGATNGPPRQRRGGLGAIGGLRGTMRERTPGFRWVGTWGQCWTSRWP